MNYHTTIPMASDAATKLQAELDRQLTKLHEAVWRDYHNAFVGYQASAIALRDAGLKTVHTVPGSFPEWLKLVAEKGARS